MASTVYHFPIRISNTVSLETVSLWSRLTFVYCNAYVIGNVVFSNINNEIRGVNNAVKKSVMILDIVIINVEASISAVSLST